MAIDNKNIIIGVLLLVIGGLIYFGVIKDRKIAVQTNLITASADSLHHFKTSTGSVGGFISTLQGTKEDLVNVLKSKLEADSSKQAIIDSLNKDKNIQSMASIKTESNSSFTHKVDTVYSNINFRDSISTKWYDADINVSRGISKWGIRQKDELNLTTTLKDNKGWFTGSTLTTYATSANPDERVTGLTSVSTVINKSKLTIRPAFGIGLNSDLHGQNTRLGYNAGVVLTFK